MSVPGKLSSAGSLWCGVLLLAVLHQDFWNWDNGRLLLGFLPVGLAYHVGFSLAAASFWAYVVVKHWPSHLEEWAAAQPGSPDSPDPSGSDGNDA